jgi:hypothetical protein
MDFFLNRKRQIYNVFGSRFGCIRHGLIPYYEGLAHSTFFKEQTRSEELPFG